MKTEKEIKKRIKLLQKNRKDIPSHMRDVFACHLGMVAILKWVLSDDEENIEPHTTLKVKR